MIPVKLRTNSSSVLFSASGTLGLSGSSFLIFGGRPKRGATSQSRDRLGLPTFPLRTGGVALFTVDVFINLCQSCSHTKVPFIM